MAWSKAAFANNVKKGEAPFDKVNFDAFRAIFDQLKTIIQLSLVTEERPNVVPHGARSRKSTLSDDPRPHPTPLIGRERELAEIERMLVKNRLVTLVGAGGIGKTRVASQIGANLRGHFHDGVSFIGLKELRKSDSPRISGRIPRRISKVKASCGSDKSAERHAPAFDCRQL